MTFPPLAELLPHRPPMLLLRRIVAHDPTQTICLARFDVGDGLVLGYDEALPAALAMELVAQAMAVHDGLRRRAEHRPAAVRGFLLGSRRFELLVRTLPVGEELRVVATGEGAPAGRLVRFLGRVENHRGVVLGRGDVTVLEHRPDEV